MIAAGGAIFSAALGSTVAVYFGFIQINNPDKVQFPVRGVDVSHHQSEIDWVALGSDDVSFAFIKATEGSDVKARSR